MTILSTVGGASLLAHGLHVAIVLVGLWGLGALLLPHVLHRYGGTAGSSLALTEHDRRVAALRTAAASGTLSVSPVALLEPAPPSPARPREHALGLPLAVVGSVAAAGIHAAVTPPHLGESALVGVFFLAATTAQLAWAGHVLRRPTPGLLHLGLLLNGGLLVLWSVTRTLGLPFGLLPAPHAIGAWGLAAVAFELAVVASCIHALRHPGPAGVRRVPGWFDFHPTTRAAVGAAAVALVLLTLSGAHS